MINIIKDILTRRSLIRQLVLKDLKIRYARPFLGFFWAFLSPFLLGIILYIVFYLIFKVKIDEAPFFLYLMSGVFPWRFFQDSLMCSVTSLVDNKNLIRESNFPPYLIPVSIVFSNVIIYLPSLVILITVSVFVLKGLSIFILLLPLALITHLVITLGLSVIFSILYVRWRDIKYILEPMLVLLLYLTPVFYSLYMVKTSFKPLLFKIYLYNPFVAMLNFYRTTLFKEFYSFIQKDTGILCLIIIPLCFAALVLALGFYSYHRNKSSINDYLSY